MSGKRQFFEDILHLYGVRAGDALAVLLNNERFIMGIQKMLQASLEFRDFMQKAIQTALTQLNLPTRDDFARLEQGQQDLEDRLFAIEAQIERLQSLLAAANESPKRAKTSKKRVKTAGSGASKTAADRSSLGTEV